MPDLISTLKRIPIIEAFFKIQKGKSEINNLLLLVNAISALSAFFVFLVSTLYAVVKYQLFAAFITILFSIPLAFNNRMLTKYLQLYLCIVVPTWYPVAILLLGGYFGQALASATTIFITLLLFRKERKLKVRIAIYNILLFILPTIYVGLYGPLIGEVNFPFDELMVYFSCLAWLSVTFYIYDDTKTREFSERLQEKNKELTIANTRLNEKSKQVEEFAFIITHDLQEPLRNIGSISAMLNDSLEEDASSQTKLMYNYLESSSNRLIKQVRGLLEFASVGNVKKKKFIESKKVVGTVIEDLQLLINETNTKIQVGELPNFRAYEMEFRLLFQNLISNGIKYRHDNRTPEILINAEQIENGYLFSVKDNGIGIDEIQKNQIFKVFNRLHETEKYQGLGLGLANCKRIVELHEGEIWVDSELSKGSTFLFTVKTNLELIG